MHLDLTFTFSSYVVVKEPCGRALHLQDKAGRDGLIKSAQRVPGFTGNQKCHCLESLISGEESD